MATRVHMEALSPTMEEGQLVRWLKNEGDAVAEGDVLAEVETDKATMELVARGSGVLRKRMLAEGQSAAVGSLIAIVASADEDISGIAGAASSTDPGAGAKTADSGAAGTAEGKPATAETPSRPAGGPTEQHRAEAVTQAAERPGHPSQELSAAGATVQAPGDRAEAPKTGAAPAAGGQQHAAPAAADGGRTKASPLARKLASEAGLDIASLQGSGPGGRIIRRDIEEASKGGAARSAVEAPAPAPAFVPTHQGPDVEEVAVSQMRKTIAKRLVTSIGPVPTFYLTVELDMSRMSDARESINARLAKSGVKVSVNDLLVKAVAMALTRHPEVNAAWAETSIRRYRRVHIGVAVAVEDGLITPIIRDAHLKGVIQISQEVRELAGRAREKKLQPDEYTGATFSISNLGMFGIDEFTAIINPPEAAILAVGRVEEKPVVVDGAVVVQPRMRVTMSCDHRVIDGATGAKFLQTLRDFVEEPTMMIV